MNTKTELNSVKKLVLEVLEQYPETRNSDNKLYIQCAKELGGWLLDDMDHIGLSIVTLHKVRQKIQNGMGLFKPNKETQGVRTERQLSFKEWMVD